MLTFRRPPRRAVLTAAATALAVAAAVIVLALTGPQQSNDPTPRPKAPLASIKPVEAEGLAWPLTGEPADKIALRPALAIKVENSPAARPQTGLEQADMVWEQVVEGGITRFVAVYHSQVPKQVAPVRSVRPMDPAIVAPLGGILAFSGAQQPFIDAVKAEGIQTIINDAGDPGFRRTDARRAPHNLVGDPSAFWEQAAADRTIPPPPPFKHAEGRGKATATRTGSPATRIDIKMSGSQHPSWKWDQASATYLRSEGTEQAVSADGVRLSARNVLALSVDVVDTPFIDPVGTPVPETILVGTGTGIVASGGKHIPIKWTKSATDAPMVLTTTEGKPVELALGNTWIELVPKTQGWTVAK